MYALRRVMPLMDALKVVCRSTRDRTELDLSLKSIHRRVFVRANTSDVKCVEKVFVDQEYRLPSDINEKFSIQPQLIVDAGANIGMATLFFAHLFPQAHVYAIEPESSNFDLLRRNCEGMQNLTLKKAALWPYETKLQVSDSTAENWAFSVRPSRESVGVDAITIPQILELTGATQIDLLKLDIEGAERELFSEGCEQWLPRVRMIVIELHDRFKSGCSEAFYSQVVRRGFIQEIRGENIFVLLNQDT